VRSCGKEDSCWRTRAFALTGQPAILAYNPRRSRYATDMQKPRTRRGFIMVAPNGVDPLT
jgi:hypothetical protein